MLNSWSKITENSDEVKLIESDLNEEVVILNQIYCNMNTEDNEIEIFIRDNDDNMIATLLYFSIKPKESIILGSDNKLIITNGNKLCLKSSKENMNVYISGDKSISEGI